MHADPICVMTALQNNSNATKFIDYNTLFENRSIPKEFIDFIKEDDSIGQKALFEWTFMK